MSETRTSLARTELVRRCLELSPDSAADWLQTLDETCAHTVEPAAAAVDEAGEPPHEAIKALREIGAFGVQIPRAQGGLGFGNAMAALAVERTAQACASTAAILMFHYQVVHRTLRYAADSRRRTELPAMASGDVIGASAWTEPGARTKTDVRTQLSDRSGRLAVEGAKTYCTGLATASVVDVLAAMHARQGEGPTFVRVRADAAGVDTSTVYRMLGLRGTSTGTVTLADVEVADTAVLGGPGTAPELMRANHETPLNPGLLALGISTAALRAVGEAVGTRTAAAPDKPLPPPRALGLARTTVAVESAYAYAAHLVALAARSPEHAGTAASKLKAAATDTAENTTRELMHVTGSRGFLADLPLERHLRDAQATALMGPANELCLQRIADAVG